MKKLIEELEAALIDTKRLHGDEYFSAASENAGIDTAIQIVKSHKPWYPVGELPPDGNRVNWSLEVIVKNKRNEMTVGHYNYNHSKWECDFEPFIPIKWTYLPDIK